MAIRITPAVKALMIACFAAFVVQQSVDQFFGGNLLGWLALVPSGFVFHFRFWQIFTYAFLHGDVMHLFLNLLMLAFIGGELEGVWGTMKFLRFYFFCAVSAGVLYLLLQLFAWGGAGMNVPMVGASGAIYGLLMAYGILFSERVLLFMMLFPMKAKHFVWVLGAVEFMSTLYSGRGGLSSAAHLGGMLAGLVYLWGGAAWVLARRRRAEGKDAARRNKRKKAAGHLKLVINNRGIPHVEDDDGDDSNPKTWH